MIFRQFLHLDPVGASYLIGCGSESASAVVDPQGDIDRYIEAAGKLNVNIDLVIDTHVHADHLSVGRALAARCQCAYGVSVQSAGSGGSQRGFSDGEIIAMGNVHLQVLFTPGHTPEHICLLVTDQRRGGAPWVVLTGHTLMVGDMGRTELVSEREAAARDLFRSAERLRTLPDEVLIMPGAYSGSVCGRSLSATPVSTIGFERRYNAAFSITDEEEFVAAMLRDVPPQPPEAAAFRAANLSFAQ